MGSVVSGATGCGSNQAQSPGCQQPQRQQAQFPNTHLLPNAATPSYITDPPTSGPHLTPAVINPVYDEPLAPAVQVGIIESGRVIVHYRDPAARSSLVALAGGSVVVAPNPSVPDAVVLSGWLMLQRCATVEAVTSKTVSQFLAARPDPG